MDWVEQVADFVESLADGVEGSGGLLSELCLELREGHFYGIEVGRVGWQRQEPGAALTHQLGRPLALVEGDIVEDDDVAWHQFGRELGFDVELEAGPVHRRIDDPGRDHAMTSEAGDEGLCLPAAERRGCDVAFAAGRPAGSFGQPCVGRGLVDEDQPRQGLVEEALAPRRPVLARLPDVGALLLAGPERLFL